MKSEVWLRPNRRALWLAMALPALVLLVGVMLAWIGAGKPAAVLGGGVLVVVGLAGLLGLVWLIRLPRLAYRQGFLLVYLRGGQPFQVPIEIVEVFFRGQGPSLMPRQLAGRERGPSESSNVVVRLAESARSWHQRPVRRSLGNWCEGYITIRGTWCEPLSEEVFRDLNRRLILLHRQRRESAAGEAGKRDAGKRDAGQPAAPNGPAADSSGAVPLCGNSWADSGACDSGPGDSGPCDSPSAGEAAGDSEENS